MIKRLLLYIVVMLILLALAFSAGQWDKDTTLLQQHSEEISVWLSGQESEGLAWGRANAAKAGAWQGQSDKAYTVLLHRQDSVISWSNTKVIPVGAELRNIARSPGRSLLKLPLGWFLCHSEPSADYTLTVLVPIRYALNFNTLDQENVFPAGKNIDENIAVTTLASDYPIIVDGKPLAWLHAAKQVQSGWLQWLQLTAWLLFFILFFSLLNQAARWLNTRTGALAGTALLLVSVAVLLWLNIATGFTQQQFSALPLFAPSF